MPPPPNYSARYPLLDAWRGFACLIVVLHHAGFVFHSANTLVGSRVSTVRWFVVELYHKLNLGVPLFFVISGYCIAASMDAQRSRGGSSWQFLGRRIWRIYPPYWAAVACFAAIVGTLRWVGWPPIITGSHSLHLESPTNLTRVQWLGNLLLIEEWRPYFLGGGPYRNLTRISWTLCFEEQFYLVSFVLLLLFPRKLFGAILGASLLIFAVCLFSHDAKWYREPISHTFVERWHDFAVGLVVYWRLVHAQSAGARRLVDLALVGLAALGVVRGGLAMTTVALFGLTLIALRPFDDQLIGWRVLTPFQALGKRCYSIYLIHLPVCVVVAEALIQLGYTEFWTKALLVAPLVALAGVGAGWIFAAGVESRFLNRPPARLAPSRNAAPTATGEQAERIDLLPVGGLMG